MTLEGLLKEFALYESFILKLLILRPPVAAIAHQPGLSPELQQLKRQIDAVEEEIDTYLTRDLPNQLPQKVPAKVLRIDQPGKHDDGWSLRVNKGFEKHITKVPGYVEIKTVKAGIVFITKKLRGLNSTLSELNDDYNSTASRFLQQAIQCADLSSRLSFLQNCELDVYVSLAT